MKTGQKARPIGSENGTDPITGDGTLHALDRQFVWGLIYIDEMVCRFRDTDHDGDMDETYYVAQDRLYDATSLFKTDGSLAAVFTPSHPYGGKASYIQSVQSHRFFNTRQGLYGDIESGMIYNRERITLPPLGRFAQRDPLGYVDGANLYEYVRGNPVNGLDPLGLVGSGGWPPPNPYFNPYTGYRYPTFSPQQKLARALALHWLVGNGADFISHADGLMADRAVRASAKQEVRRLALDACEQIGSEETLKGSVRIDKQPQPAHPWLVATTNTPSFGFNMRLRYTARKDSDCCCIVTFDNHYQWADEADLHPLQHPWPDFLMQVASTGTFGLVGQEYLINIRWRESAVWQMPTGDSQCEWKQQGWPLVPTRSGE